MPSRMSCSEVMTSAIPDRGGHPLDDLVPDEGAGPDDVDPPGVHERQRGPLLPGTWCSSDWQASSTDRRARAW